MERKPINKKKVIIISIICFLVAIPLIIIPVSVVIVYESIFGVRYETEEWMKFSLEEYEGLISERSDFKSDYVTLAGYKYYKINQEVNGLVVIAHGLGGGGHNIFIPFIDYFTSNGYYVFAYDAKGNDNSEGKDVEGFPQGVICLNDAINHVKTIKEYEELPIALFGHSWGGYSIGNVLNFHPEVKAAVIVAGFNESEDMLSHHGRSFAGPLTDIMMPYLQLYERIKFGREFADITALEGFEKTNAGIMIVHSKDDEVVPIQFGYEKFYEKFKNSSRFKFVTYEDRAHNFLFYSEEARVYQEQIDIDYQIYINDNGLEDSKEIKKDFVDKYIDKKKCFEPDPILFGKIIEMFNEYCTN